MARPLRIEIPGALYHVTTRGNARAPIVVDDADRRLFLDVLGHVIERFLLFRNTGFFPYWIKQATESPYTHVALASWLYNDKGEKIHLECVEFREWRGGRVVNLSTLVKLFNKEIDVYRVSDCLPYLEYDGRTKSVIKKLKKMRAEDITHCMKNLTGMTYGWKRLLWLSRFHLGFLD